MIDKEEIIKELDKQNRELGEELSLTKDRLNKEKFEKDHYKHLYNEVKKRNDNAIKFLKSIEMDKTDKYIPLRDYKEFGILLRMLGEIDENI